MTGPSGNQLILFPSNLKVSPLCLTEVYEKIWEEIYVFLEKSSETIQIFQNNKNGVLK